MERLLDYRYAETIRAGFERIPLAIADRLRHVHFLCGVDPLFVGLHEVDSTEDGRSNRDTAHVAFGYHQNCPAERRRTTVVLPVFEPPWVIVHELGHALHEVLDFRHVARPVTNYAETDQWEAFAEAFTAWLSWEYFQWTEVREALLRDRATLALFGRLAEGMAA